MGDENRSNNSTENNFFKEYTTVNDLMSLYGMSRATVIKWAKSDPKVRHLQEGTFLRIHKKDFSDMIERKVAESMKKAHGDNYEKEV